MDMTFTNTACYVSGQILSRGFDQNHAQSYAIALADKDITS
jgi:hypothetical protein